MKLNILSTAAALALAGVALSQSAKAQFVAGNVAGSANDEDLILSFFDNNSSDNGSGTDYELDLGNVDRYLNATSTISVANVNTDLSGLYSTGTYSTNTNLGISILGVYGSPDGSTSDTNVTPAITPTSVFVSLKSPLAPYPAGTTTTIGAKYTEVSPIYTPGAVTGANAPTDGSTTGSFLVPVANGSSFKLVSANDGFGTANSSATFGLVAPQLYLEELLNNGGKGATAGTAVVDSSGYFTVTSGGEVEFVVAATPEPSTYALMLLGGAFLFWILRRKNASLV